MTNQITVAPVTSTVSAFLDPSGLGPLPTAPLIPAETLTKHKVFVEADNRFRSACRLMQALWREDRELPMGTFIDADGTRRKLGSSITRQAGEDGANFMSPAIAQLARRELIYRELNAMYDVARLRTNLLSSMPLTFNFFGLLKRDLDLATRYMAELMPGLFSSVDAVLFEHSPGRGQAKFTGDYSAFDVVIRGTTRQGLRGIAAFEIKYSESMGETVPLRLSGRLTEIARDAELYRNVNLSGLWRNPHQQLVREHCLLQSMLDHGFADVGLFILASPQLNHLTQSAAASYSAYLNEPRQGRAHFVNVTLERLVECYAAVKHETFARMIFRRYLDFWLLDGELNLDDPPASPSAAVAEPPAQSIAA
jgi:hypothetical protein